jgi:hypothetical protein
MRELAQQLVQTAALQVLHGATPIHSEGSTAICGDDVAIDGPNLCARAGSQTSRQRIPIEGHKLDRNFLTDSKL